MPVTAADVHDVAFNRPPIGKRGYDAGDVDAFLDEVEQELVRLIEENNDLRTQLERGDPPAGPAADPRLTAELGDLKPRLDRLQRDKAAAEQAARAIKAELEQMRAQAGPMLGGEGGQPALRVLTMAQRTADDHVGDARREADKVLSEARSTAEDVTRRARATADALQSQARHRHQEAIAGLDAKRTAVQTHIEELEEFERGYRTRLRAYLEGLLRDLGGRGHSPAANRSQANSSQSAYSPNGEAAPTSAAEPVP